MSDTNVKHESEHAARTSNPTSTSLFGTVGSCTCGFADVPPELPCEVHPMPPRADETLVERLRALAGGYDGVESTAAEAADEIERLRAELEHRQVRYISVCAERGRLREEVRALRIGHGFSDPDSLDAQQVETKASSK